MTDESEPNTAFYRRRGNVCWRATVAGAYGFVLFTAYLLFRFYQDGRVFIPVAEMEWLHIIVITILAYGATMVLAIHWIIVWTEREHRRAALLDVVTEAATASPTTDAAPDPGHGQPDEDLPTDPSTEHLHVNAVTGLPVFGADDQDTVHQGLDLTRDNEVARAIARGRSVSDRTDWSRDALSNPEAAKRKEYRP